MTITAYYHGRLVWTAEGANWPPGLELELIGSGWTYTLTMRRTAITAAY